MWKGRCLLVFRTSLGNHDLLLRTILSIFLFLCAFLAFAAACPASILALSAADLAVSDILAVCCCCCCCCYPPPSLLHARVQPRLKAAHLKGRPAGCESTSTVAIRAGRGLRGPARIHGSAGVSDNWDRHAGSDAGEEGGGRGDRLERGEGWIGRGC